MVQEYRVVLACAPFCPRADALLRMTSSFNVTQLEAAINRARATQPATGPESALTREVALMAGLYGRMIWERQERIALESLSPAERAALTTWLDTAA